MATILIVDDRPNNRQFLLALLGNSGHKVLEAANGLEALGLMQSARPDLVITDILMPTMDGYEFVTRLRADPQLATTPVIFYTATYSEAQAMRLAASCGVDTVLPKPSDPSRILAAVDQALHGRGQASGSDTLKAQEADKRDLDPATWARATYLRDLRDAKDEFKAIAERDAAARSEPARALEPSKGSSGNGRNLQRITLRLCSLIEVGFALSMEHDSDRLLEVFFGTASDLIDSRVSALAMLNQRGSCVRTARSGPPLPGEAADQRCDPECIDAVAIATELLALGNDGVSGTDDEYRHDGSARGAVLAGSTAR
jgi:CheY-like chemotaxis protein